MGSHTFPDGNVARPIEEYHEDMGDVLWWKFPITEPPYVGSPNDLGKEVVIEMPTVGFCTARVDRDFSPNAMPKKRISHPGGTFFVGGWPGYHTHFTTIALPSTERRCQKCGAETRGEEAFVNGQVWCHPCADAAPADEVMRLRTRLLDAESALSVWEPERSAIYWNKYPTRLKDQL